MSEATLSALEDALRAHLADEAPNYPILTDRYLIAAAVGDDAWMTDYLHACSGSSPLHTLMGLVAVAHRRLVNDHDAPADDEDDD